MIQTYHPPYTITSTLLNLIAEISEKIGRLTAFGNHEADLWLRRANRIRTIHGSLAIEGNTLSETEVATILNGKQVIAPLRAYYYLSSPPITI